MHNGFVVIDSMIIDSIAEGSEEKFFICIDGERFLVKDSSFDRRRQQSSLAPYCEYVGSNFIRLSGLLLCQKTYLGVYEGRPVVICEDLFNDCIFRPFKDLLESDMDAGVWDREYTYDGILRMLEEKSKLKGSEFPDFKEKFWLMFLFDAILGNIDRHRVNWGFVKKGSKTKLAPIFDNGCSLFPNVDLTGWKDYQYVKDRVIEKPKSQFGVSEYGGRPVQLNFYEAIKEFRQAFESELAKVANIDYRNILAASIIDVPPAAAEWFRTIIECRFRLLVLGEDFDSVWESVARRYHYDLY